MTISRLRRTLSALLLFGGLGGSAVAVSAGQPAPDFIRGGQWFNAPTPPTIASLRGKVVIVNLWVYSCINCHNSLPTLKRWYDTYRADGLEIVGIHTPELSSDRPAANVAAALKVDGISWPVMQDNDNATWNAYNNEYWPTFYLIDRRGVVRMVHAGEISSRYPQAIPGLEAELKKLLAEK
ncbi:redoxin domain-containing protein [Deinococcus sp. KNUC1210]|uniref:redoxin domain-containing protein n=1 Tax=Deinococcus sp. KNUC1210 TaxID=2917691 RepID=UPI001EF1543C|nr:redoxin domain-containing protein [Deinococcus sp. KNUC1210]ULH16339.1 redoxin domain-containing protein [Deinococcus sp. KNUC1210]